MAKKGGKSAGYHHATATATNLTVGVVSTVVAIVLGLSIAAIALVGNM